MSRSRKKLEKEPSDRKARLPKWKRFLLEHASYLAIAAATVQVLGPWSHSRSFDDYLHDEGMPASAAQRFKNRQIRVYDRGSMSVALTEAILVAMSTWKSGPPAHPAPPPDSAAGSPLTTTDRNVSKIWEDNLSRLSNAIEAGEEDFRLYGPKADLKKTANANASRQGALMDPDSCYIHPPGDGTTSKVISELSGIETGAIRTKGDPEKLKKIFKEFATYHEATHCLQPGSLALFDESGADLGGINTIKATEGDSPELREAEQLLAEARLIRPFVQINGHDHMTTYALRRGVATKDQAFQDEGKFLSLMQILLPSWQFNKNAFPKDASQVSVLYHISKSMLADGALKDRAELKEMAQDFVSAAEHINDISEKKFLNKGKPLRPLDTRISKDKLLGPWSSPPPEEPPPPAPLPV